MAGGGECPGVAESGERQADILLDARGPGRLPGSEGDVIQCVSMRLAKAVLQRAGLILAPCRTPAPMLVEAQRDEDRIARRTREARRAAAGAESARSPGPASPGDRWSARHSRPRGTPRRRGRTTDGGSKVANQTERTPCANAQGAYPGVALRQDCSLRINESSDIERSPSTSPTGASPGWRPFRPKA